ncbi:MAG: UDP-glucose/GDP-mannose dehydrogenase family protein [Bacteroidetes bacterium]|nr:UDP-glucose/GDP-mannose dehydrogenase family protein [Bacteroidota bacterium]
MKIAVIGTGYVGLVSGTCFAETGNEVICVDIDEQKVERLRNGEVIIYEPGLTTLFERNLREERLSFTTDAKSAVQDAEIIFLALPTPPGADGAADLSYVLNFAAQLGDWIQEYKVIVDKSTVPVGTADLVTEAIAGKTDVPFDVVSNPEFLREGSAVNDFLKPDRVVIGTSSDRARKVMEKLYEPFVMQGNPIVFMDERSAEMTKYAANSYLATRISFMNEIANLCERMGANVDHVRLGIGSDTRIGKRFLFPGIGYGGSCFPKDVQALARTSHEHDYDFRILNAVMDVNRIQKSTIVEKIKNHFGDLNGMVFGVWGLAFKPNTDDIREAPALTIIDELIALGATIKAFDPEAMSNVEKTVGGKIEYAHGMYEALEDADALVIVTEWSEFRNPNFDKMAAGLKNKIIFDGRNVFDLNQMKELGYYYESVGRPIVNAPK